MKIKKYVGETIQDTIFMVKAELGSDAIILNTKKIKEGGFFGFFTKHKVQVLAALEEKKDQSALTEINNLKNMVAEMQQNMNRSENNSRQIPDYLKPFYQNFIKQGIRRKNVDLLFSEIEGDNLTDQKQLKECLELKLEEILGECLPVKLDNKQKVVLFTGPTGVGKTTTIAKLAANFSLNKDKKVGLLTADTYRIAAIQQLQTYSDIVNIPMEILYDTAKLQEKIKNVFAGYDLVLIDTAGSSWNDKIQLGRLKEICKNSLIDEIHLLLGLNTKSEDIRAIIDNFSILEPDKFLFTKIDETSTYGEIINLRMEYDLPFSYITNGQDVPDDIEKAKPAFIINHIMGDLDV